MRPHQYLQYRHENDEYTHDDLVLNNPLTVFGHPEYSEDKGSIPNSYQLPQIEENDSQPLSSMCITVLTSYDPITQERIDYDLEYTREIINPCVEEIYVNSERPTYVNDESLDFNRCTNMDLFKPNESVCRHDGLDHRVKGTFCVYNIIDHEGYNIQHIPVPPELRGIKIWNIWKKVLSIEYLIKKVYKFPLILNGNMAHKFFSHLFMNDRSRLKYDVPYISSSKDNKIDISTFTQASKIIGRRLPNIIKRILEISDNHLFLCGGSVLSALDGTTPNDYDIFFVGNTTEEADSVLYECLSLLKVFEGTSIEVNYCKATRGVITVNFTTNTFTKIKIQFIKRLYTSPGQILDGFDLPGCKYGYGDNCGFFTTFSGALALITRTFPIDTKQITTSHSYRIEKYCISKKFNVLLPGRKIIDGPSKFEVMGGSLKFQSDDGLVYAIEGPNTSPHKSDYKTYDNHPLRRDLLKEIPLWNDTSNLLNKKIWRIATIPHTISLRCLNPIDAMLLGENVIDENMLHFFPKNMINHEYTSIRSLTEILGDRYKDYLMTIVNGDEEAGKRIVDTKWSELRKSLAVIANGMKGEHRWKTMNPGDQYFGKVNPLKITPTEWYGEEFHLPVYVGITVERQIPLLLALGDGFPKDILNLIMTYWAKYEIEILCSTIM